MSNTASYKGIGTIEMNRPSVTALLNKIMPKVIQYLIAELRLWNLLEIINDFWRRIEKVHFHSFYSFLFFSIHSIHSIHSFHLFYSLPPAKWSACLHRRKGLTSQNQVEAGCKQNTPQWFVPITDEICSSVCSTSYRYLNVKISSERLPSATIREPL